MYHPQANCLVERFNRVLKSYIQLALLEQCPVKETVTEYLGAYRATLTAPPVPPRPFFYMADTSELLWTSLVSRLKHKSFTGDEFAQKKSQSVNERIRHTLINGKLQGS